jgi:hypothetical protein
MYDQELLITEVQKQVSALRSTETRITLLSVSAPDIPPATLESCVRAAAAPLDVSGPLGEGNFGLLSLRSQGPDGGAGVEHRFLSRLQSVLAPLARRHSIGVVRFRAVHRWACELTDGSDLVDLLRHAPAIILNIPSATSRTIVPFSLAKPVSSVLRWSRVPPLDGHHGM